MYWGLPVFQAGLHMCMHVYFISFSREHHGRLLFSSVLQVRKLVLGEVKLPKFPLPIRSWTVLHSRVQTSHHQSHSHLGILKMQISASHPHPLLDLLRQVRGVYLCLYVCVYVHVSARICTGMSAWVWRPEVSLGFCSSGTTNPFPPRDGVVHWPEICLGS